MKLKDTQKKSSYYYELQAGDAVVAYKSHTMEAGTITPDTVKKELQSKEMKFLETLYSEEEAATKGLDSQDQQDRQWIENDLKKIDEIKAKIEDSLNTEFIPEVTRILENLSIPLEKIQKDAAAKAADMEMQEEQEEAAGMRPH